MATIIQFVEMSGIYLGYFVSITYVLMGVLFALARVAITAGLVPERGKGPIVEFLANFK